MLNILLAEDNVVNQFVTVKSLQHWGIAVSIANNGQEALDLIGTKSFQLVLMDLNMPVMDGYEATRRIREMDGSYFKTIPIVAFTASEIDNAREKAIQCGMTDFTTKPIENEEFQTTLDKYVYKMRNENSLRRLEIDFDQYTDGDFEFKRELVSLMVADLKELQNSIAETTALNDPEIFLKARHKCKTTVSMIGDTEFTVLLTKIATGMQQSTNNDGRMLMEQILHFNKLSGDLVNSLSDLNHAGTKITAIEV